MRRPARHKRTMSAKAVRRLAGVAHNGDDLFDRRRISQISQALVAWRAAMAMAGQGRSRATTPGRVEKCRSGHAAKRSVPRLPGMERVPKMLSYRSSSMAGISGVAKRDARWHAKGEARGSCAAPRPSCRVAWRAGPVHPRVAFVFHEIY